MTTAALAIEHIEKSSPPLFTLTRLPDGKAAAPVTVPSPYQFPVEGQPNSQLMRELRWYLEHFLDYPFPPEIAHPRWPRRCCRAECGPWWPWRIRSTSAA